MRNPRCVDQAISPRTIRGTNKWKNICGMLSFIEFRLQHCRERNAANDGKNSPLARACKFNKYNLHNLAHLPKTSHEKISHPKGERTRIQSLRITLLHEYSQRFFLCGKEISYATYVFARVFAEQRNSCVQIRNRSITAAICGIELHGK